MLSRATCTKTEANTNSTHTELLIPECLIIQAITPKHMNTSFGVNRAGVHCRALSAPLAPEPIFPANLNKKNLQTFAGTFRLMFNLLLFDTVPSCISFPFPKPYHKPASTAVSCGGTREGKLGEEEKEGARELRVFFFLFVLGEYA